MPADVLLRHVCTFGRVLREGGLEIGPGRLADALSALDHVDVTEQDDVYWALSTTLVARREDLDAFDKAFAAWFLRAPERAPFRVRVAGDRTRSRGRDDAPRHPARRRGRRTVGRGEARSAGARTRSCAPRISRP